MSGAEFLLWMRGPGISFAALFFIAGVVLRLIEILMLGRTKNLAELRGSGSTAGMRTIATRFLPADANTFRRSLPTIVLGYLFHIGLFVVIFLLTPHIKLFQSVFHIGWPGLPTPVVDFFTVVALVSMLGLLWRRVSNRLLRFLSTGEDYLSWAVTFMPLLTGYLSYHHLLLPYSWMLGIHILSVALLLVIFPFTKLMHSFTLFIARYYNGAIAGEKGVQQ